MHQPDDPMNTLSQHRKSYKATPVLIIMLLVSIIGLTTAAPGRLRETWSAQVEQAYDNPTTKQEVTSWDEVHSNIEDDGYFAPIFVGFSSFTNFYNQRCILKLKINSTTYNRVLTDHLTPFTKALPSTSKQDDEGPSVG